MVRRVLEHAADRIDACTYEDVNADQMSALVKTLADEVVG